MAALHFEKKAKRNPQRLLESEAPRKFRLNDHSFPS
jgi:hypothetical protein